MEPNPKQELHEHIQRLQSEQPMLDGAVLSKWVLVSEWQHPDGGASLHIASGEASGTALTRWDAAGMLSEALCRPRNQETGTEDRPPRGPA